MGQAADAQRHVSHWGPPAIQPNDQPATLTTTP